MTPEQLERVFEPFTQADATIASRFGGGTGLGLALTKRFCNLLGGQIVAESKPQVGSIFTMRLPAESHERIELSIETDNPGMQS